MQFCNTPLRQWGQRSVALNHLRAEASFHLRSPRLFQIGGGPSGKQGGCGHIFSLRIRSCFKIFESGPKNFEIRLLFRLRQPSMQPDVSCEASGGQLIWVRGRFEKSAFSGKPYLLIEIEASLGSISLRANI